MVNLSSSLFALGYAYDELTNCENDVWTKSFTLLKTGENHFHTSIAKGAGKVSSTVIALLLAPSTPFIVIFPHSQ